MTDIIIKSNWGISPFFKTSKPCELYIDTLPTTKKVLIRVLWLVEPPEVLDIQKLVIDRKEEFDLILCWQQNILDTCENSKLFPFGTCWISDFDINLEKEYCVTSLVGSKGFTHNQQLRQVLPSIVSQIKTIPVELFNSKNGPFLGLPKIERSIISPVVKNELFYSQFHIVIENVCYRNFFTEKIIDCFQTKTIPIYLGCPNINDFFDSRGMFIVSSIDEIKEVCNKITTTTYANMKEFVNKNYELSFKYANYKKNLDQEITSFVENYRV